MEEGVREGSAERRSRGVSGHRYRIVLLGGNQKEGETTPLGCKIASSSAFREGCQKADPVLLGPVMLVDIITPSELWGGDRRHSCPARRDQGIAPKGAVSDIRAKVPLKAMFGYSTDLRSATQGRPFLRCSSLPTIRPDDFFAKAFTAQ